MLTGLNINNFAIIKQLNLDLESGMTVITGETGAGKSIAIDALSLCMGYRSDTGMIRHGSQQAQVSATFTIDKDSIAYDWLEEKSLLDDDQPTEVVIRRLINLSGPSKAYINGHSVSLSFLKEFTQYLVHLHGQHAPQLLLKPSYQLTLVDRYINKKEILEQVAEAYRNFTKAQKQYQEFITLRDSFHNEKQLLEYKHRELEEADLREGEYEELEQEYKILSNQQLIQESQQQILGLLSDGHPNINSLLSKASTQANRLAEFDKKYENLKRIIDEGMINIQESIVEAQSLLSMDDISGDINQVEARLNIYNALAKKNQVLPEQLYQYSLEIKGKLKSLNSSLGDEEELKESLKQKSAEYLKLAGELSQARKEGANRLSLRVVEIMQELNMKGAEFFIQVNFDAEHFSSLGSDSVCFMLNSNRGQQAQELSKVASGGELSRIALAIQLLTASHLDNGTLIFDEVDVGISGKTATVVGRIIRQLSQRVQVISVTHLAQVAAYASHHFQVEKSNAGEEVDTRMSLLDESGRISALASLIGHENINQAALDNARSLLEQSQQDPALLKVDELYPA